MNKIILLRHGETRDTVLNIISGHRDVPLTEHGLFQAYNVSQQLIKFGIKNIVSSDLIRAKRTAEIVAESIGLLPLKIDTRFRERKWGDLEGSFKYCGCSPEDLEKPIGGESLIEFQTRVLTAFEELQNLTLVVTHAGPIRCILNANSFPKVTLNPCEYICIEK